MKTLFAIATAIFMLGFSTGALADSENWSPEKQVKVDTNRCANAGIGNGAELINQNPQNLPSECRKRPGKNENAPFDRDPGNSNDKNPND